LVERPVLLTVQRRTDDRAAALCPLLVAAEPMETVVDQSI